MHIEPKWWQFSKLSIQHLSFVTAREVCLQCLIKCLAYGGGVYHCSSASQSVSCPLFARVCHVFRVLCTWASFWSHIILCGTWGAISCAVDMQCTIHMQHTTVSYHSFIPGFVVQALYFTTAAGNAARQDLDVWHPRLGLQAMQCRQCRQCTAAGKAMHQDCHPGLGLQWLSLLITHVFLCFSCACSILTG